MFARAWAGAGLLTGVIAGVVLLAVVALLPDPRLAPPTASPGSSPSAAATPGATTAPSPTAAPASASPSPGSATGAPLMHIGEPAPVLALQLAAGGFTDLQERRGEPAWVIFVTTGCTACAGQVQLANGFLARYGQAGLVVLAVDVKEDAGTVAAWARQAGATFPVLLDLDGATARDWGVAAYPSHFWIGADGVIRDAAQGPVTAELAVHGLEQVLPGVTVTP